MLYAGPTGGEPAGTPGKMLEHTDNSYEAIHGTGKLPREWYIENEEGMWEIFRVIGALLPPRALNFLLKDHA